MLDLVGLPCWCISSHDRRRFTIKKENVFLQTRRLFDLPPDGFLLPKCMKGKPLVDHLWCDGCQFFNGEFPIFGLRDLVGVTHEFYQIRDICTVVFWAVDPLVGEGAIWQRRRWRRPLLFFVFG